MASRSLADFLFFRNQQIVLLQKMEALLWDIESLMAVPLLASDFFKLPLSVVHGHFSVIDELTKEVIRINETNLGNLLKQDK
jgi:hypothetical protein